MKDMVCLTHVQDRKGGIALFNSNKIREPLLDAFKRIKVLPPDKDPKPIAEEITRRVVSKLEQAGNATVTKDDIVAAQRIVFTEIINSNNGHPLTAREMLAFKEEFLIYAAGFALVEQGKITADQFTADGVPREEVSRIWQWNVDRDCHTVEKLNEWVRGERGKDFAELIRMAEERYETELRTAAEMFLGKTGIRALKICGPSSSGKTTTANRVRDLIASLSGTDIALRWLEVDMLFKPASEHEKHQYALNTKSGVRTIDDYDYETPAAYRTELLNQLIEQILAGKEVWLPKYSFGLTATVEENAIRFSPLKKNEILVLDCLHGLHPSIASVIPNEQQFKLYIEAMNTNKDNNGYARWTDIRLIRRMLRDIATRGHRALFTLLHWHLVRKGEEQMIPYIHTADIRINGGMPYDLPVLKKHGERFISAYMELLRKNPQFGDALVRAERVQNLFEQVETASEEQISRIPANSVVREFVGGNIYHPKFPYGLLDTKMPEEI